jgi:pyruvate/2-oxoglutarate dehydrogenase complex dihydrolipoamide dehydrogenase (E3) component
MIGCETATYLATLGRHVTVVEMLPSVASDEEFTRQVLMMKMFEEMHIETVTDARITAFDEKGTTIEKDGKTSHIATDTVVLALGMKPDNALAKQLEGRTDVKVAGDSLDPRNALEAIREGFQAGVEA